MTERQATILLIEDGSTYAKLATLLLKAIGYAVTWASTAEEGLRIAREETPDLILTDINLPGVDGFRAVRMLRQDPRARNIPTLGLTAARIWSEEEHRKAREAGFDAYVEKPIDKATFRGVVEPFLGSPQGPPGGASAVNRGQMAARLLATFLAELEDHVRAMNADLLALEAKPADTERLNSLYRVVHTLKGAARAVAVAPIERACHALETMLVEARDGKLSLGPEEFALLSSVADALTDAGQQLKAGGDLVGSSLTSLSGRLKTLRHSAGGRSGRGDGGEAGP